MVGYLVSHKKDGAVYGFFSADSLDSLMQMLSDMGVSSRAFRNLIYSPVRNGGLLATPERQSKRPEDSFGFGEWTMEPRGEDMYRAVEGRQIYDLPRNKGAICPEEIDAAQAWLEAQRSSS